MGNNYICLNCGFEDVGNYCSNCASLLKINSNNILDLIEKRLAPFGFQELTSNPSLSLKLKLSDDFNAFCNLCNKILWTEEIKLQMKSSLIEIIGFIVINEKSFETYLPIINSLHSQLLMNSCDYKKQKISEINIFIIFIYSNECSPREVKKIKSNNKRKIFTITNKTKVGTFLTAID